MQLIEFAYLSLVFLGIVVACRIIGLRHLYHVASPASWFLLSVLVAYFSRPLIFFINNDWYLWNKMHLPPFEDIGLKYGLVVCLFVIAFALGYGPSLPLSAYFRKGHERLSSQSQKIICLWLIVFTIFGYFMALKYRPVPGLGDGVQMAYVRGWTVYQGTTGYLVHAVNLVPACGMIYYAMSGRLGVTALVMAPYILLQIYFGWGRSFFLLPTIGFLGLAAILKRTSRGSWRQVAAIFLTLLLMLPVLAVLGKNRAFFRKNLEQKERVYQLKKAQGRWTSTKGAELTGFSETAFYIANSGKSFPHNYCLSYIYTFFVQPIPRMFWKDKPVPSDFNYQTFGFRGMAPGTLGDPYHQLGWFGVILWFVHGWMVKRAMVWFASSGRPSLQGAYGFLLAFGEWTPFGWATILPFYLLPVFVTYLIERREYLGKIPGKLTRTFPAWAGPVQQKFTRSEINMPGSLKRSGDEPKTV